MIVDYVEIEILAGRGGDGSVHFVREKFRPKGGPDGGNGGRGGSVVFVADSNLNTLLDFRYSNTYRARAGQPGGGGMKSGKSGEDVLLRAPVGTILRNASDGQPIGDLDIEGKEILVARGGRGGRGNVNFKSATNQTPREFTPGRNGDALRLALELKLIADVGLVGLPNAGKSTLLSRLSAARPKIADYPFTTLEPNLGIVRLGEFRSFVMADIPGIIEGAAGGKGLGLRFLRHIQRTKLLLYMIDCLDPDLEQTLVVLKKEVGDFDTELLKKPTIVALNKVDLLSDEQKNVIVNSVVKDDIMQDVILISGASGEGLKELLIRVERELERIKAS